MRVDIGALREGDGSEFTVPLDFKSEHPVDFTHVVDFEVLSKSVLSCFDKIWG